MEYDTNNFTPAKWVLEVGRLDDKIFIYLNDIQFFSHQGHAGNFNGPKNWDLEAVAREALRMAYLENDEFEIQKFRTLFSSFMNEENIRLKLKVVNHSGDFGIAYKLLKDGEVVASESVFVHGQESERRDIEFEIVRFCGHEFLRVISKFS